MNVSRWKNGMRLVQTMVVLAVMAMWCLIAVPKARADYSTNSFGVTNKIAPAVSTTANVGKLQLVSKQDNCGLGLKMNGDAAGTAQVTVALARSWDGTNLETQASYTFNATMNGAGVQVQWYTNLPTSWLGAAPYVGILYVTNASGTVNATNFSLELVRKSVKPSP